MINIAANMHINVMFLLFCSSRRFCIGAALLKAFEDSTLMSLYECPIVTLRLFSLISHYGIKKQLLKRLQVTNPSFRTELQLYPVTPRARKSTGHGHIMINSSHADPSLLKEEDQS